MGMPWPSLSDTKRCAERGCPFPPAPGEALCQHHLQMFLFDESLTDDALETDFSKDPEEPKHRVSIASAAESRIGEWRLKRERVEFRKLLWKLNSRGLRIKRVADGLCRECGKLPNAHRKLYCESCFPKVLEQQRRSDEQLRKKRKLLGLCKDCGSELDGRGHSCCKPCRDKMKSRYRRLLEAGRCTKCTMPVEPDRTGMTLCAKCSEKKHKSEFSSLTRTAVTDGLEENMFTKNRHRYLVTLSCPSIRLSVRRIVSARSKDAAYWKVQNEFFDAHQEILEGGLSVGGSVEMAR